MRFDPDHLHALAAILRMGSFEAAAGHLGVTPSAVSQRIKALEEKVGAALIERASPCVATPTGQRLARHAEDIGLLEARLARELSLAPSRNVPARLRIAVNADSLGTWFVSALSGLPDFLFDLVIDDQDHSHDWLKRGEVCAAITSARKTAPGCNAMALGALRYEATASPGFMAQWFANGVTTESLRHAPCLTFNAKDALQRSWIRQVTGETLSPPCHFLPSTQAFVDAACAGIAWGMNPESLVRDALRDGRLVTLLPDSPLDTPLAWQVSRIMATALEPVTRSVRAAAKRHLRAS
jgi:LysR family transcriptional regulator (chromosome initiation inhibitor)